MLDWQQMMKIKPQIYYWLFSAPILIFGIVCLAWQLTAPDVVGGSYAGYVGGMWRGDEGFNFRTTPSRQYAEDILGLMIPYMLIGVGIWLGIAGHKCRKTNRIDGAYVSDVLAQNEVWPPPPREKEQGPVQIED